eukprot:Clim_evm55s218 gene=Clim_evmTU55s218
MRNGFRPSRDSDENDEEEATGPPQVFPVANITQELEELEDQLSYLLANKSRRLTPQMYLAAVRREAEQLALEDSQTATTDTTENDNNMTPVTFVTPASDYQQTSPKRTSVQKQRSLLSQQRTMTVEDADTLITPWEDIVVSGAQAMRALLDTHRHCFRHSTPVPRDEGACLRADYADPAVQVELEATLGWCDLRDSGALNVVQEATDVMDGSELGRSSPEVTMHALSLVVNQCAPVAECVHYTAALTDGTVRDMLMVGEMILSLVKGMGSDLLLEAVTKRDDDPKASHFQRFYGHVLYTALMAQQEPLSAERTALIRTIAQFCHELALMAVTVVHSSIWDCLQSDAHGSLATFVRMNVMIVLLAARIFRQQDLRKQVLESLG